MGKKGTLVELHLPRSLHEHLAARAIFEGVSLDDLLVSYISEVVGEHKALREAEERMKVEFKEGKSHKGGVGLRPTKPRPQAPKGQKPHLNKSTRTVEK